MKCKRCERTVRTRRCARCGWLFTGVAIFRTPQIDDFLGRTGALRNYRRVVKRGAAA